MVSRFVYLSETVSASDRWPVTKLVVGTLVSMFVREIPRKGRILRLSLGITQDRSLYAYQPIVSFLVVSTRRIGVYTHSMKHFPGSNFSLPILFNHTYSLSSNWLRNASIFGILISIYVTLFFFSSFIRL